VSGTLRTMTLGSDADGPRAGDMRTLPLSVSCIYAVGGVMPGLISQTGSRTRCMSDTLELKPRQSRTL
jgi:hypothetical protein